MCVCVWVFICVSEGVCVCVFECVRVCAAQLVRFYQHVYMYVRRETAYM